MRLDMHCHTKEGSPDGKIALTGYISLLKEKGYQGMLLTDHNSYQAYHHYINHMDNPVFQNFTILKGIEYDTIDAGHFLVVMPQTVSLPVLEVRGLPVAALIEVVHNFGGILGPAHPCGEKYMSFCNTKCYKKNPGLIKSFDFMETFNACETDEANLKASRLAVRFRLPGFGGSDSHKTSSIGCAYTDLPDHIHSESDLIAYIKKKAPVSCGGHHFPHTLRARIGIFHKLLVHSFWFYNKAAGLLCGPRRRSALAHRNS